MCKKSEITKIISEKEFEAKLTIDYKVFEDSYISLVSCHEKQTE